MSYPRQLRSVALLFALIGTWLAPLDLRAAEAPPATAEQWGVFELTLAGPASGNPFTEVELAATFTQGSHSVKTDGFYDGAGVYKVRFMPETTG